MDYLVKLRLRVGIFDILVALEGLDEVMWESRGLWWSTRVGKGSGGYYTQEFWWGGIISLMEIYYMYALIW